jgi:hypothetical protein
MSEDEALSGIKALSPRQFKHICHKILVGLGFANMSEISLSTVPVAFQGTIERKSTDGMDVLLKLRDQPCLNRTHVK